ncbi:hypothetical protein [Pseudomonas sp. UBA6753]|uniref:hypothetical protein n=1 Tax=Pseudomonas sp. UBA6753 TaxID=1947336 RepID=UPI00257FF26D|nr:hypothetical protein [Pseudomonas sp. UBA6753]
MTYEFKGDNKALVTSITALLALDAKGALTPHGIGGMARQLLEASSVRLAEQHHDEPAAWRYRHSKPGMSWFFTEKTGADGCLIDGFDYEVQPLYTHADSGEVKRLTQERDGLRTLADGANKWRQRAIDSQLAARDLTNDNNELHAKLAERDALLREIYESAEQDEPIGAGLFSSIKVALSASAEPSAPKFEACKGNGVIGWRRGQTAESYEEGESPCEDYNATGYAHSNGMPESGTCTTCNGLGTVPDGEITGLDGAEFENGPIECIKDCPACKPGAPTVTDEPIDLATWKRRAIEAESKLRTFDPRLLELSAHAFDTLLAEPKPQELVLTKCKLCDQLQADLTERDEKLDQTQDLLRFMVHDYRSVVQAGYDRITALGSDCDSVAKMLDDNPNYQKAMAVLLPDLESRPEERGTPETEPCSGCGTPGWTGACNKCVPY